MRSSSKKLINRLLSMVLALTMVLGMVPFTALAAPYAGSLTDAAAGPFKISASIESNGAHTKTEQYNATMHVTIKPGSADGTYNGHKFSWSRLEEGAAKQRVITFDTLTVSGGSFTNTGTVTLPVRDNTTTPLSPAETINVNVASDKITFDVDVSLLSCGTINAAFYLYDWTGLTNPSVFSFPITVPRKADITSLTATPSAVTAGQDFTVKAESDINNGYIEFTYNDVSVTEPVMPRSGGGGYATHTFTAVAGKTSVAAKQFGMSDGVVDSAVKNATVTVNAIPVTHTITYMGNAADAYNVPAAETVADGEDYNVTTAVPNRTGFTFVGWDTNKDATTATYPVGSTSTIPSVGDDITLYAIWAKNTVTVNWPDVSGVAGITGIDKTAGNQSVPEGSTQTFTITVTNGYDGSAMVVTANGSPLYGTKGTGNTYTYTFPATANPTKIEVAAAPTLIPTYYNVKFVRQTADATAVNWPADFTVEKGTLSVAIPNQIPTRDGYTFVKWAVGGGEVLPGHNITIAAPGVSADLELRAVWEQDKVDVTYPADVAGVTDVSKNGTETVVKGSLQSFTVTLGTGYDPATLTVTANGVALAPVATGTAGQYQYSFVANADTTIAVSTPSLLQYTVTLPTGENFNALFTAPTPNVTSVTVNYNEGYTFKVAPVGNYTISEVYINGVAQGAGGTYSVASVTGPQTISIVMEAVTFYTVTYVVDGVQLTTRQVQSGTLVKDIADLDIPTKEGYTPTAWYTNKNYSTLVSAAGTATVDGDMEVYAKYNPKTYSITYDMNTATYTALTGLNDGGITATTKTFGQTVALSAVVPTATNYVFKGWAASATGPAVYQPGDSYSTESSTYTDVTLYAVWEKKTFTINLSSGVGCSLSPSGSYTVEYGADLTVDIVVERAYAATAPAVKVDTSTPVTLDGTAATNSTGGISHNSAAAWTYKLENITADHTVLVTATKNAIHTVNFYAVKGSTPDTDPFLAQSVEHGYYATQPAAPAIEGYKFVGWYQEVACTNKFNFGTAILASTNVYAKYTAITSTVTLPADDLSANGWWISFGTTNASAAAETVNNVAYKDEKTFYIFVANGYDATNMQVSANGYKLAPIADATTVADGSGNSIGKLYTFTLYNITEDQTVTVTGVARKMITITYNDNGGIGGPGQEQVPYYLTGASDNGEISLVEPTRVGYTFLGWVKADTNGDIPTTPAYSNPAKTLANDGYDTSDIANFITDTTLYAVWSAKSTTVTLTVDKTSQYEGENVVLTADVTSGGTAVTSGSVQFYRYTGDPTSADYDVAANWKLLDSKVLSGGKATLTIATSDYVRAGQNKDSYKAVFVPDEGAGYSTASSTDPVGTTPATKVTVNVLSTAISWKLTGENIATGATGNPDANELTIKKSDGSTTDSMTAGQVYTLELPAIYALDDAGNTTPTALVVNKDYTVTWQFRNASGTWEDYTAAAGTDSVKILAEYSQYVFRAVVTPLTGATGHFTKAAVYTDAGALTADSYVESLVTKATSPVAQQETATKLEVSNTHDIPGATSTDPATVAEFEGQNVTLTATVTLSGSTTTMVTTGEVYFYNGTVDPANLIGKANVQSDGTAVLEATISEYNRTITEQKDTFKAVYQENATYEASTSANVEVRIRSTAIAWTVNSGAEVKTLTVTHTDGSAMAVGESITAGSTYKLTLPTIVEDGRATVTLVVGKDYTVEWYEEAPDGTITKIGSTETDTFTVTPATENVQYYAQVLPKTGSNYTDAYEKSGTDFVYKNFLKSNSTENSVKAATTTTITFGGVKTGTGTPNYSQYEEKTITITAQVMNGTKVVPTGTVTFYVVTANGTNVKIGTATVNNGLATVSYTLPEYALSDTLKNIEYFFAMYTDTAGTYADSNTTDVDPTTLTAPLTYNFGVGTTTSTISNTTEAVQIRSTAITWKLNTAGDAIYSDETDTNSDNWVYANKLTVSNGLTATEKTRLTIPNVYALDDMNTALTVGKDYQVTWEYMNADGSWTEYASDHNSMFVDLTPEYEKYQFRAQITAVPGDATPYTKTVKYTNDGTVIKDTLTASTYTNVFYSVATDEVALKGTTTTLTITAPTEGASEWKAIDGANVKFYSEHFVQFEGQTVTLNAQVKDASDALVQSGKVYFYRYVDGTNDVKLNATAVEVVDGVAQLKDVAISDYDTAKHPKQNVDKFYAVYQQNATYDDSSSLPAAGPDVLKHTVYIKSTTIQTPVIKSDLANANGDKATTYSADLTGLLAGVKHTFTLVVGANGQNAKDEAAAANWSVVALDGRTVASTDYTIQWLVTTGTNEEKAANNETAATFVVNESKSGDKYRVKLVPTADGDMKTGATSNYVVINSLQNVTVKVTAIDVIKSTAATDVYQLNNITLTAEVQGKDSQIMKPSGNVTFYYSVDNTNWVEIDTAALKLDDETGTMKATIVTDQLPVDVANGYKQEEVTITAVYAGDETFNKSGTATLGTNGKYEIVDTVNGDVTDATVTVYSSVVLVHADDENKATSNLTPGGIHIEANGDLVANETDVALTLQQVYTLDYNIDLSKLVYGTDYTVEWQILENASLYNQSGYYGNTEKWNDIGATGRSYTIGTVPQDAAYRAEITVVDTAAAVQGSAQGVLQAAAGDPATGRQVYYSNVLVVGAGQATVTTNITTSANTYFNEEGIVEGETVTIHALAAGASNVTPISNLTVTITPKGSSDVVFTDNLTTVNGYNAFTWNTAGVTPGYYTLTVEATSNNGYAPQTITRTLIVRDKTYTLTATNESKVYNGKAQGIDWTLTGIDIENALAQKSVVVYYYEKLENGARGMQVEPTQFGEYIYEMILPASAYWTEKSVEGTFKIEKRTVDVVDLVAQAKVYDGTTDINELEVILNDSAIDGGGAATGDTGIINGDSIYATGVMTINAAGAGNRTLSVSNVTLHGDDVKNYVVGSTSYTETINVQRSQVKGDIANSTFKYTGSNITVPADDIILIDQAGNVITSANYTVTYYYHNGDGVEKATAMNKLGKYTVIARPEQDNYKGGAVETIYVVSGNGTDAAPTAPTSTLINISNTVELYGVAGNRGIDATATNGATTSTIYYVNGAEQTTAPTDAGRYLVKVTASTGDTAYGIYTIVKANPVLTLTAAGATYTSDKINGYDTLSGAPTGAEVYYTWTGGTIQGVSHTAPTEAGDYVVTAHVGETANYTAHEVSANFTIAKAPLKITADDLARWQYGSYPDMVATFEGLATGGVAADTSLRDVQIQPEFIFNDLNGDGQPEYTNSALDQVGRDYPITVRNALARNYTVTYVAGSYAVNELDPKADLAIHGMIDNGITNPAPVNIAYYGDQIQLYAYGNYKSNNDGTGVYNPSSLLKWSLSTGAPATIDQDGLLTITGVGDFTVTLTRGSGDAKISTSIEITAKPKEVVVNVPDVDKVYNALEQTYDGTVTVEGRINGDTDSATLVAGDKRTNVGSQIVTYKVNTAKYVSEVYGGLFTINDKEVTVAPVEQTKVYGTKEAYEATDAATGKAYSETGVVGGKTALTTDGTNKLGVVASVSDLYENIDVSNTGYEILVAGPENMNYNVKYTTAASAATAKVTAKGLTFKTGVINSDGRTSGYMENDDLFFEDAGFAITGTTFNPAPNDRMYGEVNPVMDYLFDALIAGDSEADLVSMLDWLVEYSDVDKHNINGDANVKFNVSHLSAAGYRATGATEFISGAVDNYVIDGMLAANGVKNYTTTVAAATQNIYQRPVALTVRPGVTLTAYKPSIIDGSTVKLDVLKQLLLNNLVVGEYSTGKGGLATLLGHTIEDLDIQIVTATYNGTDTINVTIKLGNTNYWTEDVNFTVKVDPTKIVANYGSLGWTSATVTMTGMDEHGNNTGVTNVTGDVQYLIFVKDTNATVHKYSHYKNLTPVRSVTMTYGGSTGLYIANYDRLSAGDYVMFAIVEGYTIIE